jgi:hypothetical protein
MAKAGRPTDFTQELANKICKYIMDGKSLRQICEAEDMPNRSTVHEWLSKDEIFANQYARARDTQADTLADDIVAISDTAVDKDSAAAAKVRVDARKWVAAKLKPKRYGDKLDLDQTIDGKITIQTIDYRKYIDANTDDSA